jgi:hypothetical protein
VGPACLVLGIALGLVGCREKSVSCDCLCPPVTYPAITSEQALIKNLEAAYRKRDYEKFTTLFSNATLGQPAYLFLLSEATPSGETSWGYAEEMRIHRRMFEPQNVLPGENPVPPENWLQSIDISLTLQSDFVERADLYQSPSNPQGLDPARWRATEATYATYVFFQLAGATDYQVDGRANFVVIQDKTRANGDAWRWLIYRWEDLAGGAPRPGGLTPAVSAGVEESSWSSVKSLFR